MRNEKTRVPVLPMILAAGLLAVPQLVVAQSSTTTPGSTVPGAPATTMPPRPMTQSGDAMPGHTRGGAIQAGSAAAEQPRLSKLIGADIYNEKNEKVGEIDDILLTTPAGFTATTSAGMDETGPVAILQVGGFLGLGGRLVIVPLNELMWSNSNERIVLPNATKELLETKPAFEYSTLRHS